MYNNIHHVSVTGQTVVIKNRKTGKFIELKLKQGEGQASLLLDVIFERTTE